MKYETKHKKIILFFVMEAENVLFWFTLAVEGDVSKMEQLYSDGDVDVNVKDKVRYFCDNNFKNI